MDKTKAKAIIEAILFAMGESVEITRLAEVIEEDAKTTKKILQEMQQEYMERDGGLQLMILDKAVQLGTKKDLYEYIIKIAKTPRKVTLSESALETLAIVAYKQPITRVEIEEIRGVGCDMMLRKLQARNLITEMGRSEAPGRPILYGVTEEFMDSFKLLSLDELPDLPDFSEHQSDNLFD